MKTTLYRDDPHLQVARMRLYRAKLQSGFMPLRFSDQVTRPQQLLMLLRRIINRLIRKP